MQIKSAAASTFLCVWLICDLFSVVESWNFVITIGFTYPFAPLNPERESKKHEEGTNYLFIFLHPSSYVLQKHGSQREITKKKKAKSLYECRNTILTLQSNDSNHFLYREYELYRFDQSNYQTHLHNTHSSTPYWLQSRWRIE